LQQLESVVSDLTHSVKRLDEHRNDKNTAHNPQELLIQWLDSLSFPAPLNARINTLRQKIDATHNLTDMEAPLRELSELVNTALQHENRDSQHALQNNNEQQKQNGGFFSRLFGGGFS